MIGFTNLGTETEITPADTRPAEPFTVITCDRCHICESTDEPYLVWKRWLAKMAWNGEIQRLPEYRAWGVIASSYDRYTAVMISDSLVKDIPTAVFGAAFDAILERIETGNTRPVKEVMEIQYDPVIVTREWAAVTAA